MPATQVYTLNIPDHTGGAITATAWHADAYDGEIRTVVELDAAKAPPWWYHFSVGECMSSQPDSRWVTIKIDKDVSLSLVSGNPIEVTVVVVLQT